MAWIYAVVFVIALVAAYAMLPSPTQLPPAELGDVSAPTAEEGLEMFVIFGSPFTSGPNVLWYGDFKAVAIRRKSGKK